MNADGTGAVNVSNHEADEATPTWSPAGDQIAFIRTCGTRCNEVWVMNADGSGQVPVVLDTAPDFPHYFAPAWSPDGTKIAISRSASDTNQEIDIVNPDGSGLAPLTSNGVISRYPDWRPDGSLIVFDRGPAGSADIYTMAPDGSSQINLTNNGSQINESAAWSPDGTLIAFDSWRDGEADIYVMNADGSGQLQLTLGAGRDIDPDWQPVVDDPPPPVVAGTFVYDPPVGTILDAGTHTLRVTFTPDDPSYETVQAEVTITVEQAIPLLAWATPAPVPYGTPLGASILTATADVTGVVHLHAAARHGPACRGPRADGALHAR